MNKLDVLFPEKQKLKISDSANCLGVNKSIIARAALAIGLQKIEALSSRDISEAQSLCMMEELKAKQ